MKLLHTSDWHLGRTDSNFSLLEDQSFFIEAICGIIKDKNVDAVLIAGDVYDRQVSSAEAVKLYDRAVTKICKDLNTPVLVIAGNHDSAERLSNCSELLKEAGLYVCGAVTKEPFRVSFKDTDVYLLPWFTEEKVKSLFPEKREEINGIEDAFATVTENIRNKLDKSKKNVLLSHAFIADSETSTSERAAKIGTATMVPANVFDGFDYVALGHIHKPQDVNRSIRYSGTPMPYSFGKKEKQEKSVTLIDTETMNKEVIPLPLLRKRTTLTGTLSYLTSNILPEDVKNGYVNLELTDSILSLEVMSELREIFPNILGMKGKTYDSGDNEVTLTLDDLKRMENDPIEVFRQFCKEQANEEPDEHRIEAFKNAIKKYEEDRP